MIIDASVVAKWFMKGEEWEEKALDIKKRFEEGEISLSAPSLLIYEVGNVVWKRKDIPIALATELTAKIVEYLEEMIVDIKPSTAKKAIEIAKKENITFYDAIYIALTHEKKEVLITADKKLYEKTKDKYPVKFIDQL